MNKKELADKLKGAMNKITGDDTEAENNKVLQFIAQTINREESIKGGYTAPTLWLCTNGRLRKKYMGMARERVAKWWEDESRAKVWRDNINKWQVL